MLNLIIQVLITYTNIFKCLKRNYKNKKERKKFFPSSRN